MWCRRGSGADQGRIAAVRSVRPPSVERLSRQVEEALGSAGTSRSGPLVRAAARRVIESQRRAGGLSDTTAESAALETADLETADLETADLVAATLAELERVSPARRVINATGVLLHTNLGRAPLALEQLSDPGSSAVGYSNLEFDLNTGRRGARSVGLEASLCALTGAESALVVNNNAAAVLLAVSGLAAGREVVVSRGELVEIGGSFRIPDVITQGGARLVEVGTTNRTHVADYRGALGDDCAALLSVHRSNFEIVGFTSGVSCGQLAEVARLGGVPLVVDLGGGLLDSRCGWIDRSPPAWLADEPAVRQTLAAGADLVTFSADKLLGGPQGGIILGSRRLVDRLRRHPLARALRLDPLRAELLQRTVDSYLGGTACSDIPLWRMATIPTDELAERADRILDQLEDGGEGAPHGAPECSVVEIAGTIGAGAAPGSAIPGVGIQLETNGATSADGILRRLRSMSSPVVGVVGQDCVRLHLRTVDPEDDRALVGALRHVTSGQ